MSNKADYLIGRIQPLIQKSIDSTDSYLKLLEMKRERLAKNERWIEKEQTLADVERLIQWKMKEMLEMIEIMQVICREYGSCDDDQALMDFIKSKPALLDKLKGLAAKAADE